MMHSILVSTVLSKFIFLLRTAFCCFSSDEFYQMKTEISNLIASVTERLPSWILGLNIGEIFVKSTSISLLSLDVIMPYRVFPSSMSVCVIIIINLLRLLSILRHILFVPSI